MSFSQETPKVLNDEQMQATVDDIVFDLGVTPEQAKKWAEEEQDRLQEEDKIVTKEVVVTKTDAHHLDDDEVPVYMETREQEAKPWPGTRLVKAVGGPAVDLAKRVSSGVKSKYAHMKKEDNSEGDHSG